MNPFIMPLQTMNIYKYCNTNSCAMRNILPLSKTSTLNTSTVDSSESKKMSYSRWVNTYGTSQKSGPAIKNSQSKTCTVGTNRFTY